MWILLRIAMDFGASALIVMVWLCMQGALRVRYADSLDVGLAWIILFIAIELLRW
jgi:hypothetical protein